jgi:hypothetical protein
MLFKKRPGWISQESWNRLMRHRDRRKIWRRQTVRFFKNPKLAIAYARYRKAVDAADWPLVKDRVLTLADLATSSRDRPLLTEMVFALERVGCYRESADLWFRHLASLTKSLPNEWFGEDLSEKTLLINLYEADKHGLGVGYRCAHIVAKLIGRAQRTIVVLEPRQVPTFKRTFPGLEIFTSLKDVPEDKVDYIALADYLTTKFDVGNTSAPSDFQPLIPDADKIAALRKKYLATQKDGAQKPLIGLCWHSSHHGKDNPSLQEWRDFIARTDAIFVSLQYGNVQQDLQIMGADRVIVDESINQLVNMDDFCAQVAALDGVITIMSTLANVAGALDAPTIILRDDWFRRNLPFLSERMPWFPSVLAVGKNRRQWGTVLDECFSKLVKLIASRRQTSR